MGKNVRIQLSGKQLNSILFQSLVHREKKRTLIKGKKRKFLININFCLFLRTL